ncbi:MAG: 3-oxoacyl-ACP synthase III family protein, partial [Anaerolineales bacterium]
MATEAARAAIADSDLEVADIDLILMSTITNDFRLPQAVSIVQSNLGSKAKFIQVDSACTGFIDGLMVAKGMMKAHGYKNVLLIGADTLTYFNAPEKFMPLTVFGDGAGAVVLQDRDDLNSYGIAKFVTGSDGDRGDYIWVPGGASKEPFSQEVLDNGRHYWRFKFPDIYEYAIERMCRCALDVIEETGLTLDDVAWFVPHQASVNIIMDVIHRLEVPEEMAVLTYPHTGNLSAASIPVALHEAASQGTFSDGDWLVMPAVGAGMAWGAVTYRWFDNRSQNGH